MRRSLRALVVSLVGMLTLTACDFSVYDLPLPGGADVGDNSYAVKVEFRDVLDLVPQSAVKVDDVTVGKVDDITLDGYTAVVTVRLNGEVELPENAWATIRQTSLLGEKFVSLGAAGRTRRRRASWPTATRSRCRAAAATPRSRRCSARCRCCSTAVAWRSSRRSRRSSTTRSTGNESEIRSVLGELDTFMGQIDKNKEAIVAAMRSVNKLAIEVKAQEAAIIRHARRPACGPRGARRAAHRSGEDAARTPAAEPGRDPGDQGQQGRRHRQPSRARPDPDPAGQRR